MLSAALLFYFFWSLNAVLLFVLTVFSCYLNYEWLHFAYHLPEGHFVAKLPSISTLRELHHTHHDVPLMTKYNLNITYPLFDFLFGAYLEK
ncbi:MAG: hypothetical protein IPM95_09910 [Sphingobacteriales bacterium]|nr:hypothetical protein [Sphingobacteriales bacterium]